MQGLNIFNKKKRIIMLRYAVLCYRRRRRRRRHHHHVIKMMMMTRNVISHFLSFLAFYLFIYFDSVALRFCCQGKKQQIIKIIIHIFFLSFF